MLLVHCFYLTGQYFLSSPGYSRSYSKFMETVGTEYFTDLLPFHQHQSTEEMRIYRTVTIIENFSKTKNDNYTHSNKKFTQTDVKTEHHNNLQITQSFSNILRYNHLHKTFRLLLLHGFLDCSSSNFSPVLVTIEITLNHRTHQRQAFT